VPIDRTEGGGEKKEVTSYGKKSLEMKEKKREINRPSSYTTRLI